MKQIFEIKDEKVIKSVLDSAEYGTLVLCSDNIPYSVPVNFVMYDGILCFHGSHDGRKMKTIKSNPKVSFSVVESYSMIQSYFSSTELPALLHTSLSPYLFDMIIDHLKAHGEARDLKTIELMRGFKS